tara:strand:+ start:6928 stop:8637 length:1710 start_codon:yes stop_codon:yes gene_type:complete
MLFLFLSFFISSVYFITLGILTNKFILKDNTSFDNNIYESGLIGIIFLSIFAFLINFIFSLNKLINDFLFFVPFFILFLNKNLKRDFQFKKILKVGISISIVSTLLISYDTVYRPDAGLYHLPFISILNEEKIIIGLSNLHFRFGHTSIIQYLSASFNNHIFLDNGILIPLALIFSFFIFYLIKFLKNEDQNINFLIGLIILIFVFFRMNRYGSFGNDAPSHFFYLYLIILAINYKQYQNNNLLFFNKISLISIFVFFNKITMLLSFLIPFYFIFNVKFLNILKSKFFVILILVFFSWIGKNILISGCAAFPLEQTCIKNLEWFDKSETRRSNAKSGRVENEAWTKGAPNQTEKTYSEFISTYEWINVWKKAHGTKILKKVTPFLIFIILIISWLLLSEKKKKIKLVKSKLIWYLFFINLIGLTMWFLKFPVFRYGYGYIISFFAILVSLFLANSLTLNKLKKTKLLNVVIIMLFIGIFLKHSNRIYENYNLMEKPWPSIYSDTPNNLKFINNEIVIDEVSSNYYYPKIEMCYYSKPTPCTHIVNSSEYKYYEIRYKNIYGYKKFLFNN